VPQRACLRKRARRLPGVLRASARSRSSSPYATPVSAAQREGLPGLPGSADERAERQADALNPRLPPLRGPGLAQCATHYDTGCRGTQLCVIITMSRDCILPH